MKWPVEKKALVGLGFASVILVGINALAYWHLSQHKSTADELVHTRNVLEKLQTTMSELKNAETEQRDYLLTGKEPYLNPYLDAVAKIQPELLAIRTLTTDKPNHQQRLDTLDLLVTQKLAELDQTINLRRDRGLEAALELVLTDASNQVMNRILSIIHEIEQEERVHLEELVRQAQVNTQKDTLISTGGILLSVILLYLVYDAIKREIAARRQAEWALQQMNAETYEALTREQDLNALKSRIISLISHEYRTPLTTILSSVQLLERYSHNWSEEKKITHLQRIQSAATHLTDLVADMLDISQAEAGKLEFNPSPLDLESFCRQLVEELQQSAGQEHPIAFVSLGNCASCMMDKNLLQQIFTHLLLNAIKFSPKNSTVQFDLQCQGDAIVFQIRDEGIGIPVADQRHLFEPFERGSNVGTISGTGLGLAIVKKLVDLHGGQIAVSSVVSVGTTVTVTLPLNSQTPSLSSA